MVYLDVGPMIGALRATPEQFAFDGFSLHHVPSRHRFTFDRDRVAISAECDCARLSIEPKQERELVSTFHDWQTHYWQPLQINREFASHFAPPSMLRRWLIALTGRVHQRLQQPPHRHRHRHDPFKGVMMPAE